MPIYEYQCNICKEEFELLVNSDTEIICKDCGSSDLHKKLSLFGISAGKAEPSCSSACGGGIEQGTCGSGMCRGPR